MTAFNGFSSETITFLRDLAGNNSKTWFDENRQRYQEHYLEPAKDFVTAIAPGLRSLHPALNAEPRVNGSIFRVNRDIRFSKDKTPYKPNIDLWFWEGERKGALSGLFFRLAPDSLILGAGAHGFQPDDLKAYRAAVMGPDGDSLVEIERNLSQSGLALQGEHYKTQPRGYATEDPDRARLLRFNACHAHVDAAHPLNLDAAGFVAHCLTVFQTLLPVHLWLMGLRAP